MMTSQDFVGEAIQTRLFLFVALHFWDRARSIARSMAASSPFHITEHVIDSQHIREYPHATRRGEDALKLVVKKYAPKSNPNPQPGDLTIIGAHGSGFPKVSSLYVSFGPWTANPVHRVPRVTHIKKKELYEPIWEGVLSQLHDKGIRIRSIWIADIANQAASGVLNGEYLGNDRKYASIFSKINVLANANA
jgi:hypothetical protein